MRSMFFTIALVAAAVASPVPQDASDSVPVDTASSTDNASIDLARWGWGLDARDQERRVTRWGWGLATTANVVPREPKVTRWGWGLAAPSTTLEARAPDTVTKWGWGLAKTQTEAQPTAATAA